jgi:SAM-dependent methyltransferase
MNITYRVEPAESTTLPDRSADAICVAQALHWFDFPAFFAQVGRVAKPGALLAAWGYNWFNVSEEFDSEFRKAILDTIHPYWAPQNQLVWDRYVNVPCPFPRLETPEFRISAQWNLDQLMAFVKTWSATRRCLSDKGDAFFQSAIERLRTLWGVSESTRTIIMPLHLLAARLP